MCEPTSLALASFALSAAGTGASLYQQEQQAEALEDAYRVDAINQQNALATRRVQEAQATTQQLTLNAKEALQAKARARTAAGEAGVTGLSVDALIRDLHRQEGLYSASVTRNHRNIQQQLSLQAAGVASQAQSRINTIDRPNYLAAGLRIGMAGLNAADQAGWFDKKS